MSNASFGTYPIVKAQPVMYSFGDSKEYPLAEYENNIKEMFKNDPQMRDRILKMIPDRYGKLGVRPTLKIEVRTSTTEGDPQTRELFIDLSGPNSEELINSIFEKVPGAENISNEKLYLRKKQARKGVKPSGVDWGGEQNNNELDFEWEK
jgi:hypothetical protein